MRSVVILKNPAEDATSDPYRTEFLSADYTPLLVPVLNHSLVNQDRLKEIVGAGPGGQYGAVVVTSARAVEAWQNIADVVADEASERGRSIGRGRHTRSISGDWSQVPFYAVGPSTDKSLHKIANNLPPLSHFSPSLILGSAEAGTGENLARYILTDYGTRWSAAGITRGTGKLPLLYLVGDKTTDVVPRVLKDGGFETLYLQVYSTFPSDRLGEDIEVAVESLRSDDDGSAPHTWIVFFAPSAAKSALPILRRHFVLPSTAAQPKTSSDNAPDTANALARPLLPARFATIGPTTATFLRDEHPSRFRVDVISPRPDAASLANAIREFDAAHAASL